jgi:heme exporter protein C
MWAWLHRFASPPTFYRWSSCLIPWCGGLAVLLLIVGLVAGLAFAPPDYQQGEAFRIIYVHVPAAFFSMGGYAFMAVASAIFLIWKIKLADVMAMAAAPVGAAFAALALITGSLWGKPMWGTWWIWDARLTSELVLLFLYFGVMALRQAIESTDAAARASGLLAVVGVVNLPIIHYSVYWWNTLHQGATLSKFAKPSMSAEMLWPLLTMLAGFALYFAWVVLLRARNEVLWRERNNAWVKEVL